MAVHPSKRAFLRRFPAPPPTPDGMVYFPNGAGKLVLISADAVQRDAEKRMADYDSKERVKRDRLKGKP